VERKNVHKQPLRPGVIFDLEFLFLTKEKKLYNRRVD